ncbi:23S rRNA pseudouridine1911/1915/1917 synthase [Sporobacter termitidis DSM 10068]|uniref:Pseudouridine synthase n=1 Tax=Sporobacter termitidis DSM 10068 TaxID=1123282 RepID=A0A1M5YXB4_9FIRM|nr:RluA family pseudouridine synthase [Sporobacter termitidis]SHI16661.1 23S rRNA pseudouridine1911/1915/1917 synthase [Sporobacter termitidis DSM 10068]
MKPPKNCPQEYTVDKPAGLLEFLLRTMTGMSRNSVKSLLTRGAVSVGGKTATKHDTPLLPGVTVSVAPPDDPRHIDIAKHLRIIYEDEELIAIDKPAGLLAIATDREKTETAYHLLTEHVRRENNKSRLFVVHRLDKDTSGVMIAAKNERIKLALQDQWNTLVQTRGYTAVSEGVFREKSGTVTSWLKETKTHFVYSGSRPGDGREAVTSYEVIRESAAYSLLGITLGTGRKNQIRVHMSDLGHPVAGDKKYGARTDPLGRLCLHAGLLEIRHPFSERLLVFQSDTPKDFLALF